MDKLDTIEITRRKNYVRYNIGDKQKLIRGRIVLERYDGIWNLELMDVHPTNQGYGTMFLKYVLEQEQLEPKNMTICIVNEQAISFFTKLGFNYH